MTGVALVATVLLLAANAFFVAVEFALIASRRPALEPIAAQGNRRARVALAAIADLNRQLAGALLGITMASVATGFLAEPAIATLLERAIEPIFDLPSGALHTISFIIALALVTFLHVVFGEMVPKNIALTGPERAAMALAGPHRVFVTVMAPVIWALNSLSNAFTRLVRIEPKDELATAATAQEFATLLDASRQEGYIGEFEHELLAGALHFRNEPVADVMVPRADIDWVARDASVADVERVVVESGHSRLIVIGQDLDDVQGYVHAKDLLLVGGTARDAALPPRRIHSMAVLAPDTSLESALLNMRRTRTHLALVQGPDRATLGIVALEDLVERLVGDIFDESDDRERAS